MKENKIAIKLSKEFETKEGYGSKIIFLDSKHWLSADPGIIHIWDHKAISKTLSVPGLNENDLFVHADKKSISAGTSTVELNSGIIISNNQLNEHLIDEMPEGSNAMPINFGIRDIAWDVNKNKVVVFAKYFPPRSLDRSNPYKGPKARLLVLDAKSGMIDKVLFESMSAKENYCLAINDKYIVAGGDELMIWDRINFKLIKKNDFPGTAIKDLKFSPDNKFLGIVCSDGNAEIFESKNFTSTKWKAHNSVIKSVEFQPNSSLIYTGGEDKVLKIWNYGAQAIAEIDSIPFQNTIEGISINSSGHKLAISTKEDSEHIYIYNVEIK